MRFRFEQLGGHVGRQGGFRVQPVASSFQSLSQWLGGGNDAAFPLEGWRGPKQTAALLPAYGQRTRRGMGEWDIVRRIIGAVGSRGGLPTGEILLGGFNNPLTHANYAPVFMFIYLIWT